MPSSPDRERAAAATPETTLAPARPAPRGVGFGYQKVDLSRYTRPAAPQSAPKPAPKPAAARK